MGFDFCVAYAIIMEILENISIKRFGRLKMKREYMAMDVYTAFLKRMEFIFREFENIYVSFSGGKDSGLLLNLVLDYQKKY